MRRLLRIGTAFAALAGAFAVNAAPVHHRAGIDSVATIMRLAEAGNASYQAELGYMYEIGVGVPQDYHLAAAWYYRAAEQGNEISPSHASPPDRAQPTTSSNRRCVVRHSKSRAADDRFGSTREQLNLSISLPVCLQ